MTLAGKHKNNCRDNPGRFHSFNLKREQGEGADLTAGTLPLSVIALIVNCHSERFKFLTIKLVTATGQGRGGTGEEHAKRMNCQLSNGN